MSDITSFDIIGMFSEIAASISRHALWLSRLDSISGDGDHGDVMTAGFVAMEKQLAALDPSDVTPAEVFDMAAETFLTIPSRSAKLYASAFRRAGSALPGKPTITEDDFDRAFEAMASGILAHGEAQAPNKNMVDAWEPALEGFKKAKSEGLGLNDCLHAAAGAALEGAEPPRGAHNGEALPFAHPDMVMDAGAASAVLIMRAIRYALMDDA